MTLILSTLTSKGAVIAADRRTVATHNQTGAHRILTDEAVKLFLGPNIVIGLVGGSDIKSADPAELIQRWLGESYKPDMPFRDQMQALWEQHFGSGNQVARQIVDHLRPQLTSMSMSEIISLSVNLISRTHQAMNEQGVSRVTVGPRAMVAVIDENGAQLVDTPKS